MTFERRADRLERLFAGASSEARLASLRSERRAEWRALFNGVLNEHDRLGGDLDGAVRRVVAERYRDLDEEEREQLADTLVLVFRHWGEVDIDEIRADRRMMLPPELREGG